jgi:hypothetical protein
MGKLELADTGQEEIFLVTGNLLVCSLVTQVPKKAILKKPPFFAPL